MIPINYDVIISTICFVAGLYAMWRIGGFSRKQYTPVLAGVTVSIGLIAWSIIALVSLSAVIQRPEWVQATGWRGTWGYTTSRIFMAIMWGLALTQIIVYSPKSKRDVRFKL